MTRPMTHLDLTVRGGLWIVRGGWQRMEGAPPGDFGVEPARPIRGSLVADRGPDRRSTAECVRYDQDCATSGIWTMRPDGSGLMTVTSVPGLLLPAIWSPDGAHLVLLDHAGCTGLRTGDPLMPVARTTATWRSWTSPPAQ